MNRHTRSPTHEAALGYAARGWKVFPIETPRPGDKDSGKAPLAACCPNGKLDATSDANRVNEWWGRHPTAGVAIALAESDLVVLDVDVNGANKDGTPKRGRESLAELEREIGGIDPTLSAVTGSGGLHAYFVRDAMLAAASKIGFRLNLDLIVNGYVVAPPSPHYTGGAYRWSDGRAPILLPRALAAAANAKISVKKVVGSADAPEAIVEGGRNTSMYRLACALRDAGIGADALKLALSAENNRRFSPPLPDHELLRIAENALRNEPRRDVALGAIIEQVAAEVVAAGAPAALATRIDEASRVPRVPMRWYETGFPALDVLLGGGVATRQVCGVVGPPSSGKSGFVGSLAAHVSLSLPVLHVSTELPRAELIDRYAAWKGGFSYRDAMRGVVGADKIQECVAGLNMWIVGCDDLEMVPDKLAAIWHAAATIAQTTGQRPLIVIDYVQLLARETDGEKRNAVGSLSAAIRRASQALDCPIVAVFSTGRETYKPEQIEKLREADNPIVYLAAAKESGDIEYDCATILFLDVDLRATGAVKPARVAVARCRVGEPGFAGARAKLDVGRWHADETALADMKTDRRVLVKGEVSDRDAAALYAVIEKHPGRTWVEYMRLVGCGRDRAVAARNRMLDAGRLENVRIEVLDSMLRRTKKDVLRCVGNTPLNPDVVSP